MVETDIGMTAITRLMVDGQLPPVSHYCHVVRAGNLIWVSGAIGVAADGTIPADVGKQAEIVVGSIEAVLDLRATCERSRAHRRTVGVHYGAQAQPLGLATDTLELLL